MMGFFSWLTGSNAESIIDGAKKGLDKAFFTEEEKSDANQGLLTFTLEYMKATQPQNVVRRILAVVISSLWGLLILAAVVAGYFNRGEGSFSQFIFDTIKELVNQPFSIVVGFYFLTQTVRAVMEGRKK